MAHDQKAISLRTAALIAFGAYLLMMASPLSEFLVYHKLVTSEDAAVTVSNIRGHERLFTWGILGYLINFIGDILAAWALFILMRPVSYYLSLLTAWIRLIYTIISLVALTHLVAATGLLHVAGYDKVFSTEQLNMEVMLSLHSFRHDWSFAFIFFGIHLILLGYLAFKSGYVPKAVGVCLIIAGLGWLADNLQPYLYPQANLNVGMIAGFGELVFMVWLIIWGWRGEEPATNTVMALD